MHVCVCVCDFTLHNAMLPIISTSIVVQYIRLCICLLYTSKTMLSVGKPDVDAMKNVAPTTNVIMPKGSNGEFNFCVPLRMLMGFAEDFTRIILNMKQELILLRTSTDLNAMVTSATTATDANADLELTKISWMVRFLHVNNDTRLALLELMGKDLSLIHI